jgi:hypothetical protein
MDNGWIDGISSGAINATPRYQVERTEVDKVNCETRCLFVVLTCLRSLEIFNRLYLDRAADRFAYGTRCANDVVT